MLSPFSQNSSLSCLYQFLPAGCTLVLLPQWLLTLPTGQLRMSEVIIQQDFGLTETDRATWDDGALQARMASLEA